MQFVIFIECSMFFNIIHNVQIWHVPLDFVNSDEGNESAVAIKVEERKCVPQVRAPRTKVDK